MDQFQVHQILCTVASKGNSSLPRSHIILKTIYRFEGGTAVLVIARHRPESGRNLKMPVEALDGEVQLISSIPHLGTTSRQPFGPPRQTDRDHTA